MSFNDCRVTPAGALDLPRHKFDRMVELGQLRWVDEEHVQRDLGRQIGSFAAGEDILARSGWLRVTHVAGRTRLFPVAVAPAPVSTATVTAGAPSAPTFASPPVAITQHARDRWAERVVTLVPGTAATTTSIDAGLRRSVPFVQPAERRDGFAYFRWTPEASAVGWVEFVIADHGTASARIVTIETERSHENRYPLEERQRLSDARRARATEVTVRVAERGARELGAWTARDPDGSVWRVTRTSTAPGSYTCACPDFMYRAGRAAISCKHVWAARSAVGSADDGAL
jgi:antitoxin (DNA-binding transcriptional repressor) of toxin-antitoxin stability system